MEPIDDGDDDGYSEENNDNNSTKTYNKTCLKRPLKNRQNKDLNAIW